MFHSPLSRIKVWVERTLAASDGLADRADGRVAPVHDHYAEAARPHPHRRELRWERDRRPGSVPPRPAHCISPVRPSAGPRAPHDTAR